MTNHESDLNRESFISFYTCNCVLFINAT